MNGVGREIAIDVTKAAIKVLVAGVIGAAALVACVASILLLPSLFGLLIKIVGFVILVPLLAYGVAHVALSILLAALATWAFRLSPGGVLLAWIVATTVGALVGGFVGSFLGSLSAALVLHRASAGDDGQRFE